MKNSRVSLKKFRKKLIHRATKEESLLLGALIVALAPYRSGLKFQEIIGPFITDFYINAARLVVEVDGPIHYTLVAMKHDLERESYLRSRGLRIIRFSNDEVTNDLITVVETVLATCGEMPLCSEPIKPIICPPHSVLPENWKKKDNKIKRLPH